MAHDTTTPDNLCGCAWCCVVLGWLQAGLVVAAADGAASAKLRRKRKAAAAAAAAAGDGVVAGAAHVAWANPKVQQRAYQAAWLAFLQGDLPGDIYRKVCGVWWCVHLVVHPAVQPRWQQLSGHGDECCGLPAQGGTWNQ